MIADANEYIVGYGSLLSEDSRNRFSDLKATPIPVTVSGWRRGWVTRYLDEERTYVGAFRVPNATMNAGLLPTEEVTDELRQRERYYDFEPVDLSEVVVHGDRELKASVLQQLESKKLWICAARSKEIDYPTPDYPVPQSYVDTCLAGCLETGQPRFAERFIQTTVGWERFWVNDRTFKEPMFPRAANVSVEMQLEIDRILNSCHVLHHRREM